MFCLFCVSVLIILMKTVTLFKKFFFLFQMETIKHTNKKEVEKNEM